MLLGRENFNYLLTIETYDIGGNMARSKTLGIK